MHGKVRMLEKRTSYSFLADLEGRLGDIKGGSEQLRKCHEREA